jgi:hypothetical protein
MLVSIRKYSVRDLVKYPSQIRTGIQAVTKQVPTSFLNKYSSFYRKFRIRNVW